MFIGDGNQVAADPWDEGPILTGEEARVLGVGPETLAERLASTARSRRPQVSLRPA